MQHRSRNARGQARHGLYTSPVSVTPGRHILNVRRRTNPVLLSLLLWGASVAAWAAALAAERLIYNDAVSCKLPRADSIYGRPGWSWAPLGHTCTWDNVGDGMTVIDNPSWMTLAPLPIVILWAISIICGIRKNNRIHSSPHTRKRPQ